MSQHDIPARVSNVMELLGFTDVCEFRFVSEPEMYRFPSFGKVSRQFVSGVLRASGYTYFESESTFRLKLDDLVEVIQARRETQHVTRTPPEMYVDVHTLCLRDEGDLLRAVAKRAELANAEEGSPGASLLYVLDLVIADYERRRHADRVRELTK